MSDPAGTALPRAAFEVTEYRRALEAATVPTRVIPIGFGGFAIGVVALIATLVVLGTDAAAPAALIATGVVGTAVLFALLVVLPLQVARSRRRTRISAATTLLDGLADALVAHLASIGYRVPLDVARDWLTADPTAVVPLVHDSVIAARWWQPAADDDRVFVEPYLKSGDAESALPALRPL